MKNLPVCLPRGNDSWVIFLAVCLAAALGAVSGGPARGGERDGDWQPDPADYRRVYEALPWEISPEIREVMDRMSPAMREKTENAVKALRKMTLGQMGESLFFNEFVYGYLTTATPLHVAVREDDAEEIRRLVALGADVEARLAPDGLTPLALAMSEGNIAAARALLEGGAKVDAHFGRWLGGGATALITAASHKQTETMRLLLDYGADPNAMDDNGNTAIRKAGTVIWPADGDREDECVAAVSLLLERGADPNLVLPKGKPHSMYRLPLFEAVENGMLRLAEVALRGGADINIRDEEGFTPLLWAMEYCRPRSVAFLLDKGASFYPETRMTPHAWRTATPEILALLAVRGALELPPAHRLAAAGDVAGLKKLAGENGDLSAKGPLGETPLAHAAMHGQTETIAFLLANGADVDAADENAWTPLFHAARFGGEEAVLALLAASADLAKRDRLGETALHQAAKNGDAAVVLALLRAGADAKAAGIPNAPSYVSAAKGGIGMGHNTFHLSGAMTALHWAAKYGNAAAAALLLDGGADVSVKDTRGRPPAFYALDERHFNILALLAGRGAALDKSVNSRQYGNLFEQAVGAGDRELLDFCLAHGFDIEHRNLSGSTPFTTAVIRRHDYAMGDYLLSKGASVNARDMWGSTPLHDAAAHPVNLADTRVIRYLLDRGADVDAKDKRGLTPLVIAIHFTNGRAAKLLAERGAKLE